MLAERLRYVTRVASKNCQRVAILNSYVFAFHCQHTAFLETTQQAADGFNRQTRSYRCRRGSWSGGTHEARIRAGQSGETSCR